MRCWWLILVMACSGGSVAPPVAPLPADAPPQSTDPGDPADDDAVDELDEDEPTGTDDAQHTLAARHILIPYKGAISASTNRSREEALALATDLRRQLQEGADFITLARERSSDKASARQGGFLGAFSPGVMTPAFDEAVLALQVGETSEPVESPFGFHVIRREAVRELHLGQIFVQLKAQDGHALPRTPERAHARAAQARARLLAGQDFEEVARIFSDGAAAPWGGDIGLVQQGTFPPALDGPAFALAPGEATEPIDTALGSHVLYRFE